MDNINQTTLKVFDAVVGVEGNFSVVLWCKLNFCSFTLFLYSELDQAEQKLDSCKSIITEQFSLSSSEKNLPPSVIYRWLERKLFILQRTTENWNVEVL